MVGNILGADGRPARRFIHGADTNPMNSPQFDTRNISLDKLITDRDRDVIVSLSKRLTANLGAAKCIVDQKANYSVGEAWFTSYTGTADREDAKKVIDWLHNNFYYTLDVRGGQWDIRENLSELSRETDISGDHFTFLTSGDGGTRPKVKNIPAYLVKTKGKRKSDKDGNYLVDGGEYNGFKIIAGIIYDGQDRAVAYRVSTGSADDAFTDISAKYIWHSFNPSQSDGRRGLPYCTHALNELKHILQSTESEARRQLILSSIGLLVENDTGAAEEDSVANAIMGNFVASDAEVTAQRVDTSIWYAQANTGYKISQMKHESGGDTFESFHDRMIRSLAAGAEWSYSLTWKPTGQGTAERGEILQARNAIISRQKLLDKWMRRVISYAYSFMARRGELPILSSPFAWEFSRPPRLSIDDGREERMINESLRLGTRNIDEALAFHGKTRREFLRERADWLIEEQQELEAAEARSGYKLDPRRMFMVTPNETAPVEVETQQF